MVFMFDRKTLRAFAPMRECPLRSGSTFFDVARARIALPIQVPAIASRAINHDAAGPGGVSLR
jgi:hypothetical protein